MKVRLTMMFVLIITATVLFAEEPVDLQMIQKIKMEAFNNSKVMETLSYLTDVHGARLPGSPNYRFAAEWAVKQLKEWGVKEAKLENWGLFGRGWTMEKVAVEMIDPHYMPLIAYPKAWTAGTPGPITGMPVIIDIKKAEDLEVFKDSLDGAIVMLGEPRKSEPKFDLDAKRYDEEKLMEISTAPDPGTESPRARYRERYRVRRALRKKTFDFFKEHNAAVILEPSEREHGTVRAYRGGSYKMDAEPANVNVVVAIEHYGRIFRMLKKNIQVELSVNIQNNFYEDDTLGFNVIAEIPGTDSRLKKEVVMLGAHLDSWHTGTGATDNGVNCAVTM